MIVLDAAFLIAFLNSDDAHNQTATELLVANTDHSLGVSPINKAEVLVGPARHGRLTEAIASLDALNITEIPLPDDGSVRLAKLRATSGSKMPDCYVLLAAQQRSGVVATFDKRLEKSAVRLHLEVLR